VLTDRWCPIYYGHSSVSDTPDASRKPLSVAARSQSALAKELIKELTKEPGAICSQPVDNDRCHVAARPRRQTTVGVGA
jgi:hypothetical protein